jgi:hypothetical protein
VLNFRVQLGLRYTYREKGNKTEKKKYIKGYVKFYQQKDRNKQNEKENPFGFVKTWVEDESNGTV